MDRLRTENEKYKKQCEDMYKHGNFCVMRYEKQMDYLFSKLEKDFENKTLEVLDACCGCGRLLNYMTERFKEQNYFGIDYMPIFIESAKERFKDNHNIKLEVGDVFNLNEKYTKKFDITINYKTLSWLPYYEDCIRELVKVTKDKIYLTSMFNDGDYETISKLYSSISVNDENYTYLNTYSMPRFKKYVESLGAEVVDIIPMHLDFDLERTDDVDKVQTWTEQLKDNSRLEITANTILNWKLVTIKV